MVEDTVREFVIENPRANYRTLVGRFGDPQKIAEGLVLEMEPEELLAAMQIRQKVLLVITCTATLLLIMRFGFGMASFLSFEKRMNGYAVVEIIEVENTIYEDGSEPE